MLDFKKINYCVQITTNSTITNSDIGLVDGMFSFISDGYTPVDDTYEDLSLVTGTFNTTLLNKDGIKPSSQSIDIIVGGDYSWASNLSIELLNYDSLHKKLLTTPDLYLVGSKMQLYVIIDGVWYSRWVGSVGEYSFNEKTFTFSGKDINNSDNTTISNFVFGYNDTEFIPVVEETDAILNRRLVKNYEPTDGLSSLYDHKANKYTTTDTPISEYLQTWYVGSHASSYHIIENTKYEYFIRLNGWETDVAENMYLQFDGSDVLHHINKVAFLSEEVTTRFTPTPIYETKNYTEITITESNDIINSYEQFFGYQRRDTDSIIASDALKNDELSVHVNIFNKGLTFPAVNGGYDVVDGKVEAITKDGDRIMIDVKENSDGSLTLLKTKYTIIELPKSVRYFATSVDEGITTSIREGSLTHLENYGTTEIIPQTLSNDTYNVSEVAKNFYYVMEFDTPVEGKKPFTILSNLVDAKETWDVIPFDTGPAQFNIPWLYDEGYPIGDTTFNSYWINSSVKTVNSLFRNYEVTAYSIVEDKEFGLMPLMNEASSFVLPNCRKRGATISPVDPGISTITVDVLAFPSTNLSTVEINGEIISTNNNVVSWQESAGRLFPTTTIDDFAAPSDITSSKRIMLEITGANNISDTESDLRSIIVTQSGNNLVTPNLSQIQFGVNSIGLYKEVEITSIEDLLILTHDDTTDNYESALSAISGTNANLPTRTGWKVGGQVTDAVNKFNIITTLCKQGFVGGYTDRSGDVKFKAFLEDLSNGYSHDDSFILDKSISDFKYSSIDKCYNEFKIKYNKFNNEFTKEIGILNVDKDIFPAKTDVDLVWGKTINTFYGGVSLHPNWIMQIDRTLSPDIIAEINANSNLIMKAYVNNTGGDIICGDFVFESAVGNFDRFTFTKLPGGTSSADINSLQLINTIAYNTNTTNFLWQTYITGISDYTTAKDLWTKAHTSYLLNSRIRTAPTERTELEYAIDMNSFYNSTNYDWTVEYAYNYVKQLVDWTTRQKLQVNYNLPITTDTIKYEILDKVWFNDKLITPLIGEYGVGWITSFQLDPKNQQIKLGITFETMMFVPPTVIDDCVVIVETGYNTTDIIETGVSETDIIEGSC